MASAASFSEIKRKPSGSRSSRSSSRQPAATTSTRRAWPRRSRSRPWPASEAVAFGDLFLEDVRAYREERLAAAGKRALFPLWGRDTAELARTFVTAGFEAILVCVDPRALDPSFAGRRYDQRLLAELPPAVDPCGENGEFHTFVDAGPIFAEPIACAVGEVVGRDGFVFCDLLPEVDDADLLASA